MTRLPIRSEHLRCKDGALISILPPFRRLDTSQEGEVDIVDPPVRLRAVPEDPAVQASGLAAYWRHHNRREGDDAEYSRVPVAIVRAFVRLHGGVAEAGEEALAELKRAATLEQADPVMGAPVTDSPAQAAEEAAPAAPLPQARGAGVAGRAEAPAAPRALDQHAVEPALLLDELTEAVIEARRAVVDFEGPVVWKKEWGKPRADLLPEVAALWRRISRGAGLASRLIITTHPRYAAHPLLDEGVRLRGQLQRIGDEALAMRRAREADEMRHAQRLNGVFEEDDAA